MKTAEEIIKKHIPNGIANIKAIGKGNGKPQYQAEINIIIKCMEEFADQFKSDIPAKSVKETVDECFLYMSFPDINESAKQAIIRAFENRDNLEKDIPFIKIIEWIKSVVETSEHGFTYFAPKDF